MVHSDMDGGLVRRTGSRPLPTGMPPCDSRPFGLAHTILHATLAVAFVAALAGACATTVPRDGPPGDAGVDGAVLDASYQPDAYVPTDRGPLDPDAACESAIAIAQVESLPVDIIWVVDNSISMAPAIQEVQDGLDGFAALVDSRALDYRVILLSLRGEGLVSVGGSERYAICIPPPLSADNACSDGPNFVHVSVDIRSTQPIEQFLGTLGQTAGYTATDARGSEPWEHVLRPEATKTLVFVTDDNARTCALPAGASCSPSDPPLTETSLEDFPGGGNPFNSNELGPGILTQTYGSLFAGYTFNAIYGWGSPTDSSVRCTYPDSSSPPSSGPTYTSLVLHTGGVRAQICDGTAAWEPFFDAVATAVERTSRIDCTIPIPDPPPGMTFDRGMINVWVDTGDGPELIGKVAGEADCQAAGGWYYDNEDVPTAVVLCPATCDALQAAPNETRSVEVQFGCSTIVL